MLHVHVRHSVIGRSSSVLLLWFPTHDELQDLVVGEGAKEVDLLGEVVEEEEVRGVS